MKSIAALALIFTSIILLSMYTNKETENFKSPDSILDEINRIETAFKNLQQVTTNVSTKTLDTPKGKMSVSEILSTNISNIKALNSTYTTLLNGPQANDVTYIRDTMQKSINEFINRYNNINTTLELKLPKLMESKLNIITTCKQEAVQSRVQNLKPATESAINKAIDDPVLTAIQTVQDAFISLKEDVTNSGIKLINTPKGMVSVVGMINENTTSLNVLAEKYQSMIQGQVEAKKYVQKNLNSLIGTFNYITVTLNIKRPKLQKDMIPMQESQSKVVEPDLPNKSFNEMLSLPNTQLNAILDARMAKQPIQLQTQMSTHGFNAPPNLTVREPVSLAPLAQKPVLVPKPYKPTYIFDILSTQSSTV